jgi:hypothetical protein
MATAIAHDPALQATSSSTLGLSISLAQLRVIVPAVVLVAAGLTPQRSLRGNIYPFGLQPSWRRGRASPF